MHEVLGFLVALELLVGGASPDYVISMIVMMMMLLMRMIRMMMIMATIERVIAIMKMKTSKCGGDCVGYVY